MKNYRLAMVAVHSCPLGKIGGSDTGGMNIYLRETALQLAKLECRVDIFTRAHQSDHDTVVNLADNVRIVHIENEIDQSLPKEALYAYFERYTCAIEEFRRSEGVAYDLVHSHYWVSGPIGQELKTGWGVPHVITFHTLGAVKNLVSSGKPESDLRLATEREVASNGCNRVFAPTEREREALQEHYGVPKSKTVIVPCGVNMELFCHYPRARARQALGLDGERIALCVARIDPVKGLDRLIRALGMMAPRDVPRLIIIGGDEQSDMSVAALKHMADMAGIGGRVHFAGRIAHETLPLFYSAADVCVVPSSYESFGMVILESLACGTPVVAADVGIASTVLKHPGLGLVVRDDSLPSLAEAVSRTLRYADQSDKEVVARRSAAARYSWPLTTRTLFTEYRDLLN